MAASIKKKDFRVLSSTMCRHPGCERKLKANIVARKPTADLCYKHFHALRISAQKAKDEEIKLAKEAKKGPRFGALKDGGHVNGSS